MMMMMMTMLLLLLLLMIHLSLACIGTPNDTVHLVQSRVRAFATLSAQERIELESLLQTHSLAFLCGLDQVFADPFDEDEEDTTTTTTTGTTGFRLATDRRRWLASLLPHYDATEQARVAWLALSLRYWIEELHVSVRVAIELLWRVNEAKLHAAQFWSPADVLLYVAQCVVRCDDADARAFRANVRAAVRDAAPGALSAAAMCATRDDDALLRSLACAHALVRPPAPPAQSAGRPADSAAPL
jgi:hypothetical protein